MGTLYRDRTFRLVALAAVFLLRPLPALADDGLPNPPNVTPGTVGKIEDVTIQGRTFKQGRQAVTTAGADQVTVTVEIWQPDGGGSRVNMQRHATIKYQWSLSTQANGKDKQLTETITVKSTLANLDTGKTTTDRDDSYKVETEWENAGTTFALQRCNAFSTWKSDGGESGVFSKTVVYSNELADDGNSFVSRQTLDAITRYTQTDPIWGVWGYSRRTLWGAGGRLMTHTVSINGVDQPNPFGCAMIERAVCGKGMDAEVNDPAVPGLSSIPFAWPRQPGFV
jgi:hypothetical protein